MSDSCCGGAGKVCPSSPARPGAVLLGIVGPSGRVGYLTPQMRIDDDFLAVAAGGRSPEKRFRFAADCVEGGCTQWTGSRCGVIDAAVDEAHAAPGLETGNSTLPKCSVRSRCRWFVQHGRDACSVCPLIITDVGADTH